MLGNSVGSGLSIRDLYPDAGAKNGTPSTDEQTNPTVAPASPAAAAAISGATGLPLAVIWILGVIGLLVFVRAVVEKK